MTAAAFWAWSLKFYEDPAVAETCIILQDDYNADVNIVLVLLWLAAEGVAPFGPEQVDQLGCAVVSWRAEVVAPLRALRRALKGRGEDAVRKAIAAAELEAERTAQRLLIQAARVRGEVSLRCYGPALPSSAVKLLIDRLAAD